MRKLNLSLRIIYLLLFITLTSCSSLIKTVSESKPPTDRPTQAPQESPGLPELPSTPTMQVFLPEIMGDEPEILAPTPEPATPSATSEPQVPKSQLTFLKNKDIWSASIPDGSLTQLTNTGDLYSFTWSPDGSMLATFNGQSLCIIYPNGTQVDPCTDLGLDDEQSSVNRQIAWSPDLRTLVLWNIDNPWDEMAISWIIVYRDGSGNILKISDPVDWGLSAAPNNEPGGVTGQAIFLADGKLLGTLSHRWLCGAGGCQYQLYRFDLENKIFIPYPNKPEEGWSEGMNLLLSYDQKTLINYSSFSSTCESAIAFIDLYDLADGTRKLFEINLNSIQGIAASPDSSQLILALMSGCSSIHSQTWDQTCGLSHGFDILPMQILDITNNQTSDLVPGKSPVWSPDGTWIAFRSCLNQNASGDWEPSASTTASIYVIAPDGSGLMMVSDGHAHAWKP